MNHYDWVLENNEIIRDMAQADRKAAEGYRFRTLKPPAIRLLSAILDSVLSFLRRAFHIEPAAIGSVHEQPSY